MAWNNRIVRTEDVEVEQILFNPRNWRIHSQMQQDAIKTLLSNVGWVQQVIINETTGHLIDGHARVQIAARDGEKTVPAVIVQLTEEEEKLILTSLDSTAGMAGIDRRKYYDLVDEIRKDYDNAYNDMLMNVSNEAFQIDLQPIFESNDFADLIVDEPEELEYEDIDYSYSENIKLVKLDISMLPEEKDKIMKGIKLITEKEEISIVKALIKAVDNYVT